jgi:parallel beta-helix repeat protein
MGRKLVLVMAFLIISMGILTLAFSIKPAEAEPRMWTVDDDGSADFHRIGEAINAAELGDIIFVKNGTYYESIVVNKTLTLMGENSVATIVDANQTEFAISIICSNVIVKGFTLFNTNQVNSSQGFGIIAYNVTNCSIYGNILCYNYYGIKLTFCVNSTLINNNVINNKIGILSESSSNCTVKENIMHNNLYRGILIKHSNDCIVYDNYVTTSNYGIRLEYSNNCTIEKNIAEKTVYYGIQAYSSKRLKINKNTVNQSYNIGISIQYSMNCTVTKNVLKNNGNWYGLEIYSSNNSRAADNILNDNYHGMQLRESNNCEICGNQINGSSNGIYVDLSVNNNVSYNIIMNNFYGLLLLSSNRCIVNVNTVKSNRYWGVWMYNSNESIFFHNNFINNVAQTYIANSVNMWNDSIEGNYWSNYLGMDQNFDGISDEAYIINENNKDNHPLLGAFSNFKTSSGPSIYAISNSTISNFTYDPNNHKIIFIVNGTEGTAGFCRICIPHVLMNETYRVTVDGIEPYLVNYTLYDDGEKRWIYFAYLHSPHEVVIVSEFLSVIILPLLMIATLLAVIICKERKQCVSFTHLLNYHLSSCCTSKFSFPDYDR